jgi:hypothetical protein
MLGVSHCRTDNPSQLELGVPSSAVYTYKNRRLAFFWGPAEFIELVREASKRLEKEDPALFRSMTFRYTVIYSPQRIFSFPLWKYGGVSNSFLVWKSEGVLAAWVYLYFHSLALTKGRWFLSAPLNSVNASKDAARRRESGSSSTSFQQN